MGIFLYPTLLVKWLTGLPHAGGDIPRVSSTKPATMPAAPRRWGYSLEAGFQHTIQDGCPTQVGIFPMSRLVKALEPRLPHAGGDIPFDLLVGRAAFQAAPRRWGYSPKPQTRPKVHIGCPTQVGIFPTQKPHRPPVHRLPHAGGDIPLEGCVSRLRLLAAPRRWGYSLLFFFSLWWWVGCPTQVGIFPEHGCD